MQHRKRSKMENKPKKHRIGGQNPLHNKFYIKVKYDENVCNFKRAKKWPL